MYIYCSNTSSSIQTHSSLYPLPSIWQGLGPHNGAFTPKGLPGGGAFDNLVKYKELSIGAIWYFLNTKACMIYQRSKRWTALL